MLIWSCAGERTDPTSTRAGYLQEVKKAVKSQGQVVESQGKPLQRPWNAKERQCRTTTCVALLKLLAPPELSASSVRIVAAALKCPLAM